MRLLVLSDLHLELRPSWRFLDCYPPFDAVVCAGDVAGSPAASVHALASAPGLKGKPILLVSGNHEFYGGDLEQRLLDGHAACAGTHVRLLDRDAVVVGNTRFIGATLWTDYAVYGDPLAAQAACRLFLNDHRLIKTTARGQSEPFSPEDAKLRHDADRLYLSAEMARWFSGTTVVVTHHAPHPGSIHPRWNGDPVTPRFASDLTGLIMAGRPSLWVHGHTHSSFDYRVGETRVLCNPKGYGPGRDSPRIENAEFESALVIEV